ncbi:ranBP-type and C3HC4-type zinc finger-containing protein 1-like [Branchiostoma lanceolatum]|uniref:ranBP-type and C3HC4-type zinc finger-containing protein 1-like n=1 Tax=Branchiostoma lanceolatum TaxID=7740 RepID=UPI0034547403
MAQGTLLSSASAQVYQKDGSPDSQWTNVLGAGKDQAATSQLCIYRDREHSGQFNLVIREDRPGGRGQMIFSLPLHGLSYNRKDPTLIELTFHDGTMYIAKFISEKNANIMHTVISNLLHEVKRAGGGSAAASQQKDRITTKQAWAEKGKSLTLPTPGRSPEVEDAEALAVSLMKAVEVGDKSFAMELASQLANLKPDLEVAVRNKDGPRIRLRVSIEDKDMCGGQYMMDVHPSNTIYTLKRMVLERLKFPIPVQRWVIQKRLCQDEWTLAKCGVRGSGHTAYLYLLTAMSAGLDRNDLEPLEGAVGGEASPQGAVGGAALQPSLEGPTSIPPARRPVTPVTVAPTTPAPPRMGIADTVAAVNAVLDPQVAAQPQQQQQQQRLQGAAAQQQQRLQAAAKAPSAAQAMGWSCPACTYVNQPTRPGCEICGTPRPEDYRVPENYIPDEEERERLRKEQQAEEMYREEALGGEDSLQWGQEEEQGPAARLQPADRQPQGPAARLQPTDRQPQGPAARLQPADRQPQGPAARLQPADRQPQGPAARLQPHVPVEVAYDEPDEDESLYAEFRTEKSDCGRGAELRRREANLQELMLAEQQFLVPNTLEFECAICFMDVDPGEGVVLRDCLHSFCRECLRQHIVQCEEADVKCPFVDDDYSCPAMLQDREIRALLSPDEYQRYQERGLAIAEGQARDAFHCKTADCRGFCFYEDLSNDFFCPVCGKRNCLTCKAIHENMTCREYQDDLRRRSHNDEAAQQTMAMLENMVQQGEAMHCPQCDIIVQKKEGCDWIRCSMCRTEICWVTKARRWGPAGPGDISGGCRCRVGGQKCHPECRNCH